MAVFVEKGEAKYRAGVGGAGLVRSLLCCCKEKQGALQNEDLQRALCLIESAAIISNR